MRILITLMLFLSLPVFSQSKGIKCTYTSSMSVRKGFLKIPNEAVRKIVLERLKEDKKVYTLTSCDGKFLFTKEPSSVDKMPLEVDPRNIFIDFNDSTEIAQSDHNGQLYITKGKTDNFKWDISNMAENILGRTCYKATLQNDTTITVWFTTDIPFGCAPLGYHGLPGLVVRMITPVYTLDLQDIVSIDSVDIKAPESGKLIDKEKYKALVEGRMKDFLDSNAGAIKVIE